MMPRRIGLSLVMRSPTVASPWAIPNIIQTHTGTLKITQNSNQTEATPWGLPNLDYWPARWLTPRLILTLGPLGPARNDQSKPEWPPGCPGHWWHLALIDTGQPALLLQQPNGVPPPMLGQPIGWTLDGAHHHPPPFSPHSLHISHHHILGLPSCLTDRWPDPCCLPDQGLTKLAIICFQPQMEPPAPQLTHTPPIPEPKSKKSTSLRSHLTLTNLLANPFFFKNHTPAALHKFCHSPSTTTFVTTQLTLSVLSPTFICPPNTTLL